MKIRQEIWTPTTHWKTALNHGGLQRPGVVFCFGNPGRHNIQAIYNEIRHSFPGAQLIFGFIENSTEEKLFLTAINCPQSQFMIDKVDLSKVSDDVAEITNRCIEKKWNQVLISLDADKAYEQKLVDELKTTFTNSFEKVSTQQPSHRIQLGLNELPTYHSSICLAMTGNEISFSNIKNTRSRAKGAAATQSMWDRYALGLNTEKEQYVLHFPFAMLSE